MQPKCPNCGLEISPGAKNCPSCGFTFGTRAFTASSNLERIPVRPGAKPETRADGGVMIDSFCKCHAPLTSRNKKLVCAGCGDSFCQTCEERFRGGNFRGTGDPVLCEKCYNKMMEDRAAGLRPVTQKPEVKAPSEVAPPLGGTHYPDFKAANTFQEYGKKALDERDFDKAIAFFRRALASFSQSADAWYGIGLAFLRSGRPTEAVEPFGNAEMLRPTDPDIPNGMGEALMATGKHEQALEYFKKAIGIKFDFQPAVFNKGLALIALGRYDEALPCLDEVTKKDPSNVKAWRAKGLALERLGRIAEADAALAQANSQK